MDPGLLAARPWGRRAAGFTLVEIIVFIVVVAVLGVTLLAVFSSLLSRSGVPRNISVASQLAQERMEIVLARRAASGYAGFLAAFDPCAVSAQPPCAVFPAGYAVTATLAVLGANLAEVTVAVTGPENATLRAQVANY